MEVQRQISYSFRVNANLMAQASKLAASNDQKLAQIIRKAIREYVETGGEIQPRGARKPNE